MPQQVNKKLDRFQELNLTDLKKLIDKVKCTYCENDTFPITDIKDAENMHLINNVFLTLTRQVLGRPVCDRGAIPRTLVQSNVVRSRLIILINEEINEANWMVSNSAKLDRRTKQHTQFGVSASNGSRDMARTKSWRKKRKKEKNNEANWMVSNSAKLDSRTKQHTQSGVSTSDGSRDIAATKSWRKKRKKLKKKK